MNSVVIPTYNERDNVRPLLERLNSTLSEQDDDFEVLVVDDDSPDRTADVARTVGEKLGINHRVIVRTSDPDLSRSVVRGMHEARGDVIVVMDADLQHPPELIPDLLVGITPDVPIAIGSRYGDGGRIKNWSLFRRIVSYGAVLLSKILVPPTRGISDPISGFFAVRVDALPIAELSPTGYKILVELLASVDPDEAVEIGFAFESRQHGETSLDLEQYLRFLRHVIVVGIRYRLYRS